MHKFVFHNVLQKTKSACCLNTLWKTHFSPNFQIISTKTSPPPQAPNSLAEKSCADQEKKSFVVFVSCTDKFIF